MKKPRGKMVFDHFYSAQYLKWIFPVSREFGPYPHIAFGQPKAAEKNDQTKL